MPEPHERLMLAIYDAIAEHGAERVLAHLEDAGIITLTGVNERGEPTFTLRRDTEGDQ